MRVLVIDDEPDVVEIVRLTFNLRWPEAEVISASTGEDGVMAVERNSPEIVILDIGLPDIDGFEVCERIRHFSDVPVVMLTARHEEVDKVKGLEIGADDYVTKPFSHIELLARVRAVLRRSESQVPASEGPPFEAPPLRIDYASREVTRRREVGEIDADRVRHPLPPHAEREPRADFSHAAREGVGA